MIYQVTGRDRSGKFACGLIIEEGKVVKAAPKLGYMKGWPIEKVLDYVIAHKWESTILAPVTMEDLKNGNVPQASAMLYITSEEPGAWPNGTAVEKIDSYERGQGHPVGARGRVVGSVANNDKTTFSYFIEWDEDLVKLPTLCGGWKLKRVDTLQ